MHGSRSQKGAGARIWSKLAVGWLKVNVDATIFSTGSIRIGSVNRDSSCRFIGVRCKKEEGVWQPREVETISLKEALSWVMELKYDHRILEMDSKSLDVACDETPERNSLVP